ncbi:hypothetical protein B0919_06055 [Hymenobacter sp. CRA2]|nr:hypothetical protein B0919_06055 [Hymenobacter sp. CRA2]
MYKDDICTTSLTVTVYANLKQVLAYMDEHYNRKDKYAWVTADNKYLMMVFPEPEKNCVNVYTQLRQTE